MNEEAKKGFKIICLECGSENCSFGTMGGIAQVDCNDCRQVLKED